MNLREQKDAGRNTVYPGDQTENQGRKGEREREKKGDFEVCALNVTLELRRERKNCIIKSVTSEG